MPWTTAEVVADYDVLVLEVPTASSRNVRAILTAAVPVLQDGPEWVIFAPATFEITPASRDWLLVEDLDVTARASEDPETA